MSSFEGGTGRKLGHAAIISAGVFSLLATLLACVSMWFQLRNYRKPLLQRYVVRILMMVPIYSIASWASLTSLKVAFYVDPLRDIYEAFTIYTFFQLLINFLGGERALIIMMHGRAPVSHPWPLNHCFSKVDISDPYTFLAIKRGILQYAWIKPLLGIATIIMKATSTYKEGSLTPDSGYLWIGILYNVSVTLSLYALAMFWVCMSDDLKPFRPIPKFLNIKLIIFATYWQGFFLSILQVLGAIPNDVPGYSADNLASAIQDFLICIEMPCFAIGHWYAFSWHDYADASISSARMPMKYAFRDAFGIQDLIQDTKATFRGERYEYRSFDAQDNVIAHEESDSRFARMLEGMRYSRNGKGKYWLPKPKTANSRTPLLGNQDAITEASQSSNNYQATSDTSSDSGELYFEDISTEEDQLYESARVLEYGDWNYPVITANIPSADRWYRHEPTILTTSTNRNLLHPTKHSRKRREKLAEDQIKKGKDRESLSSGSRSRTRAPVVDELVRKDSQESNKSGRSQLVDLVIEDEAAEETERVRARKEGGGQWNLDQPKHFIRTYPDQDRGEDIRKGYDPDDSNPGDKQAESESDNKSAQASNSEAGSNSNSNPGFATVTEESNVWRDGSP